MRRWLRDGLHVVSMQTRLARLDGRGAGVHVAVCGQHCCSSHVCCAYVPLRACRVERAVAGSSSGSSSADGSGQQRGGPDDTDPALSTAIADLHKFSMMQSMYKSAVHLLDDLSAHAKRLDMPERAQVLLAAAQNPLLGEHHFAKALLPRLCSLILGAHKATRHVGVRLAWS